MAVDCAHNEQTSTRYRTETREVTSVGWLAILFGAAAPPLFAQGWGALEVDLDPRLGCRLADPLNGRTLTVRLPLGVSGLKQLGDSRPSMFADLRRAGAGQLQAEVQPSHGVR